MNDDVEQALREGAERLAVGDAVAQQGGVRALEVARRQRGEPLDARRVPQVELRSTPRDSVILRFRRRFLISRFLSSHYSINHKENGFKFLSRQLLPHT